MLVSSCHGINFDEHPSLASFPTLAYYVRVTVRRLGAGNLGMNLLYEVADSQGRGVYANTSTWGGTNDSHAWQTITWQVINACFSKRWGYDLVVSLEQAVPFALGKVEVSTEPFK